MKNQYFGDFHDYIKYGLLRQLILDGTITTTVCWMLTENDDKKDGHRINYLKEPTVWRDFDPVLFDCLRDAVLENNTRDLMIVEESGILPNTDFYSNALTDSSEERYKYFDGLMDFALGRPLVFFDPDNGLEVKSVKYGQKGASRYLYLHEISKFFEAGHSLLVYQHLPPKPREPLIRELASKLMGEVNSESVYVFRTAHVAFFLVPQTSDIDQFSEAASQVQATWLNVVHTERFSL